MAGSTMEIKMNYLCMINRRVIKVLYKQFSVEANAESNTSSSISFGEGMSIESRADANSSSSL